MYNGVLIITRSLLFLKSKKRAERPPDNAFFTVCRRRASNSLRCAWNRKIFSDRSFFIADLLEFCHHILKGLVARSLLIDGFDLSALLRRSTLAGGLLMRSVLLTLSVARGTWSALRTVAAVIVGIELLYRKAILPSG